MVRGIHAILVLIVAALAGGAGQYAHLTLDHPPVNELTVSNASHESDSHPCVDHRTSDRSSPLPRRDRSDHDHDGSCDLCQWLGSVRAVEAEIAGPFVDAPAPIAWIVDASARTPHIFEVRSISARGPPIA